MPRGNLLHLDSMDRDQDTELAASGYSLGVADVIEDVSSRNASHYTLLRPLCWVLCSSTALYTTKRLLINHAYPLTLACHSFLAVLSIYVILLYTRSISPNIIAGKSSQWGPPQTLPDTLRPSKVWGLMLPAAFAAGASLPMLYEGLLHMPSLPVLILLFPIIYAVESLVLFMFCSHVRAQKSIPFEAFIVAGTSSLVLYNEYRLMVPGLIWGVTGILFIGLSRALFTIGSERSGSDTARLTSSHGFIVMSIMFGFFLSGVAAHFFEQVGEAYSISSETFGMMVINIIAFVGTTFTGTTLLVFSPIDAGGPDFTNIPISTSDYFTSSASNIAVLLVAIHTSPASVIFWTQIFASLLGSIFLVGAPEIHHIVLSAVAFAQQQRSKFLNVPLPEGRKYSRLCTSATLFALIVIFSCSLSSLSSLVINAIQSPSPSSLDLAYKPSSRFDIVVSMYDENPSSVKRMLETIQKTKHISTLSPNIIIYTKNRDADLNELRKATGATSVILLDNLGREGATYLHHMVHNWDSLAEQTMFIQAHAHNMRELIPRINSYLVPSTGMLSLGFTGVLCDCDSCEDRHGWKDSFNLIPSLYSKIYGQACEPETPIVLSYKGQFVASARRIRGINRLVYEDLLQAITSKDGWSHDKIKKGAIDTPDNPFFGFTLERVWSLLMQCATDGVVAAKCPSLLSGMGLGGNIEDCQCLDSDYYRL